LNSQPGFAFTIDFGDGEQQSSKHKERLQQRLLQDKKRDRKDKSGEGMAPDDLLITPRKTPDDKSKQVKVIAYFSANAMFVVCGFVELVCIYIFYRVYRKTSWCSDHRQ
jgi:hypothetical protein